MHMIRALNDRFVARPALQASDWLLPSLARFTFAAVLLWFFWYSALTKIGAGPLGFLNPTAGAYSGILPWRMEAVGYDVSQLNVIDWFVVVLGMWAEFALPLLIVIGLFTRIAALAMIGFVTVMTLVDIYGFHVEAETIGTWFDGKAGSVIADQRMLWLVLLVALVVRGGGPFSVDRLLRIS